MKIVTLLLRSWRMPFWLLALGTGAKSFIDNPILGSMRLNKAGLHVARVRASHALANWRRRRIAGLLPDDLREQFDRNGFIVIKDVLTTADFHEVKNALMNMEMLRREQTQGDTITRRIPVGPTLLRAVSKLAILLDSPRWNGALAYVASTSAKPLYYLQTIFGGFAPGPPDPQVQLHSDTFHPSMKAWLFLSDVGEYDRPLTYVAGSHRLSPARIAWEQRMSTEVLLTGDRLSQRGSFRIDVEELAGLGLPSPTRFCVPANTLVIVDTCGFHARSASHQPSMRIELWAYCRRSPFLPWTQGGLFSRRPFASRRMQWIASLVDQLDRFGWSKQHWRNSGRGRLSEFENPA